MMKWIAIPIVLAAAALGPLAAESVPRLEHQGIVDAPADKVWTAFTTREGLESWMAGHAEFDLALGGKMRVVYNPAAKIGDPGTIENTILAYEPGRMLTIKVSKAPDGFPFPNAIQKMWTVLYFDPEGTGTTRVRIVSLGFDSSQESTGMRAFFDRGNAATLERLQKHFSPAAPVK